MKAIASLVLCLGALLGAGGVLAQSYGVLPPDPVAGEEFVVKIITGFHGVDRVTGPVKAEIVGNSIVLSRDLERPAAEGVHTVRIPGLPAGTYATAFSSHPSVPAFPVGTVIVRPVAAPPAPPRGLTGNWFDPQESGWGLNILQGESGQLFIVWFDYEPNVEGAAPQMRTSSTWSVVPGGRWLDGSTFRGVAYKAHTARNPDYRYLVPTVSPAGSVSVTIESADEITLRGTLGLTPTDIHKFKRLRRQPL